MSNVRGYKTEALRFSYDEKYSKGCWVKKVLGSAAGFAFNCNISLSRIPVNGMKGRH